MFSIKHPETSEPLYEFFDRSEKFGRQTAIEMVQLINNLQSYQELTKEETKDADIIQDAERPETNI